MARFPRERPRLKDVAAAAEVGTTTASLALRCDPRIPEKTRARVVAAAQRLGYQGSAALSEAMAEVRTGRPSTEREVLAWIGLNRARMQVPVWVEMRERAEALAKLLGYRFELFSLEEIALEPLKRMLIARGVRGGILAGFGGTMERFAHFEFSPLRMVVLDLGEFLPLPLPQVTPGLQSAIYMVIREARQHGYRRFGMIIDRWRDGRKTLRNTLFGLNQRMGLGAALPVLYSSLSRGERLREWLELHEPDCILIDQASMLGRLRECSAGTGNELGVVHLCKGIGEEDERLAGAYFEPQRLVEVAVHHLIGLLQHARSWGMAATSVLSVEAVWKPGETLSPRFRRNDPSLHPFRLSERQFSRLAPLPIQRFCNQRLEGYGSWFGEFPLFGFRAGHHLLAGVRFEIPEAERNMILFPAGALVGKVGMKMASRISIPIGRRVAACFFLHACAYARETTLAQYRFEYANGSIVNEPVGCPDTFPTQNPERLSQPEPHDRVYDWWRSSMTFETPDVQPVVISLYGYDEDESDHLYIWRWRNPHPRTRVERLVIEVDPEQWSAYALLAATMLPSGGA